MVEAELHKFEINSIHKETLGNLKTEIQKLEEILKNPETIIYEEISELKRQVDLDRETLKSKIYQLADDIIQQLESYRLRFKTEYKTNSQFKLYKTLVESSKKQLSEYEKYIENIPHMSCFAYYYKNFLVKSRNFNFSRI